MARQRVPGVVSCDWLENNVVVDDRRQRSNPGTSSALFLHRLPVVIRSIEGSLQSSVVSTLSRKNRDEEMSKSPSMWNRRHPLRKPVPTNRRGGNGEGRKVFSEKKRRGQAIRKYRRPGTCRRRDLRVFQRRGARS